MINIQTSNVCKRDDLILLISKLRDDYASHGDKWENDELELFLNALNAWLTDADGFYMSRGENPNEVNTWRFIADAMCAARYYE